jgi:tetratricopeptide (TPR) repeat protein
MYIQTEPEFIPNEDVQILENVDHLFSKEDIQSIISNSTFDIKLNLICQYYKISEDSKIDFLYNSQFDYLSKYPELKFSMQKMETNYILLLFHIVDKTEVFIKDFYSFNHYLEKSTNNKIFYGLDQLDIQFQYNKKFDIISYSSQIFRNIKLLTDISTKVNLGLLSFFDFQITEEPNHKKRFIGKIKNNNNDAINVWEYHFLKTNSEYFDYFTKGLNFYKKKNYNSALELFQNALEVNPNDEISKLFLKKTQVKIEPTIKSKEGEDLFLLS